MSATISRILVPIDFGPHSRLAVERATWLASRLNASVHLLNVVEVPVAPVTWNGEFYGMNLPEFESGLVKEAERRMAACLAGRARSDVPVTTSVESGHAATTIVDVAGREEADLIVMGTHGRTGVPHLLMGSVAERVTRTAPCPVLIVRQTTYTAPRRAALAQTVV